MTLSPVCPGCYPSLELSRMPVPAEYCAIHRPSAAGPDDEIAKASLERSGSVPLTSRDNRAWCDLIHRPADDDTDQTPT